MSNAKAIRPTNRVHVGAGETARVWRCGRRRQGGAWVRTFVVRYEGTEAVRTVGSDLIRPTWA